MKPFKPILLQDLSETSAITVILEAQGAFFA